MKKIRSNHITTQVCVLFLWFQLLRLIVIIPNHFIIFIVLLTDHQLLSQYHNTFLSNNFHTFKREQIEKYEKLEH